MSFDNPSRPWPLPKPLHPANTYCEVCDKSIRTLDYANHVRGKKHREADQERKKPKPSNNELTSPDDSFGGGFSPSPTHNGHNNDHSQQISTDSGADAGDEWSAAASASFDVDSASGGGFEQMSNRRSYNPSRGGGGGAEGGGAGGTCNRCGQPGHFVRDCTEPRTDVDCRRCHEMGHMAKDCPNGGSGGGGNCYKCGQPGHISRECPNSGGGGGGGSGCRNCGEEGHIARECPAPRNMATVKCNNCDEFGHYARDCSAPRRPRDYSTMKCHNCGQLGHSKVRCPNPAAETPSQDIFGDYGGGDDTVQASGDWNSAGVTAEGSWNAAEGGDGW